MPEVLGAIINAFRKIGPVPLIGLGIVGLFLSFAPESWHLTFGVNEIVREYRGWIGITALVGWALLVAQAIWWDSRLISENFAARRRKRIKHQLLQELMPEEKRLLSPYIRANLNTRVFPIQSGIVGGLVGKGILYRASTISDEDLQFPYNMNPWARRHLAAHPKLLNE